MTQSTRAAELRAARQLFERALRDGTTMEAARAAIARERWEASAGPRFLCGTPAPVSGADADPTSDTTNTPQRSALWWQND